LASAAKGVDHLDILRWGIFCKWGFAGVEKLRKRSWKIGIFQDLKIRSL
jgi:hypothetical protein